MIVAIDGPAGSGKSSTARALAKRLGFLYLDTGAMYRAVAWTFLQASTPITEDSGAELLLSTDFEIEHESGEMVIRVNGKDVTEAIRSREVTSLSSRVSTLSSVRDRMVREQRRISNAVSRQGGGVIVEGRDIGTVVFPKAEVKIYLDADVHIRAQRRIMEMETGGLPVDAASVENEIQERDRRDTNRELSPLRRAADAITIDTSFLTPEEQLQRIESIVRERRDQSTVKQ